MRAKQFCQKVLRRDVLNWGLAQKLAIVLLVGTSMKVIVSEKWGNKQFANMVSL